MILNQLNLNLNLNIFCFWRKINYFLNLVRKKVPVSYTYKDEECDVCEIAFKVTKKCKNCDMKYKIEIKQEIDNQETSKLKNVCTTVKTLKIVLKSEAGDIQIPLEVNIKCELGMNFK